MQRLKKAIKKMAAIGTGVAMLGATMTGALAQDLADYPSPFVGDNGVFDESTAIIVGDVAAASDTLGAVDIATNLQFMAKTPVTSGSGTVQVSGGVTEDIPINIGISNDTSFAFDTVLDDSDIDSFMDTTVQFQGKDYDVHDALLIKKSSPTIETSLSASDDDYESNVVMEINRKSIYYMLYSDEGTLNISKATSSEPFEIKFLGKTLKITEVEPDFNDRFTAYVGTEYFMDVGDVVTVDGKKVTLVNVGSGGSIIVDVDGTIDTIPAASTETVNGIEVTVDETFYANTKSERAASLIIGEDSEATYQNGDSYIGEDEEDPNWEWTIGSLGTKAQTVIVANETITVSAGPFIGIYNEFQKTSDSDNPAGVGDCYDLPNNYASICLDSLTVSDEDYTTLTIEYEAEEAMDKSGDSFMGAQQKVIYLHAPGEDKLKIIKNGLNSSNASLNTNSDIKTSEIWLARRVTGDSFIGVYYRDRDHVPSIRLAGNTTFTAGAPAASGPADGNQFASFNYKDTKDNNINFSLFNYSGTMLTLRVGINGDSNTELPANRDDLLINFSMSTADFTGMGSKQGEAEASDVVWGVFPVKEIGKKDEDHRTMYGIVVKDPKSNADSDSVVLEIPGDQVQANVVIKGQASTVSGGSTSFIPADITIDTKLSSEVAGSETAHQLILVGGPCANPTVEAVSSLGTTCSGWTMGAGEAVVKVANNGNKIALLIAGTDAVDTRMAAKVVANYEDYDLSGDEVKVTGSISSPVLKVA